MNLDVLLLVIAWFQIVWLNEWEKPILLLSMGDIVYVADEK